MTGSRPSTGLLTGSKADYKVCFGKGSAGSDQFGSDEKELNYVRHFAIKSATDDIEVFQFNTAIARIMELVNALTNMMRWKTGTLS